MSGAAQALADLVSGIQTGGIKVVDLTQTLQPSSPIIPLPPEFGGTWPFQLEEISKYDERGPEWYWNNFKTGEHTGTHFDAPVHWLSGRDYPNNTTDTIPAEKFIAPACVIDCTAAAGADPDFLLTPDYIEKWEDEHGRIPAGAWVLMRTDWSLQRPDPAAYLNLQQDGAHSPGPSPDTVPFLAKERDVIGFGNETVGTDAGQSFAFEPPFPCHSGMHGANKFGLASLTNLDQLPPTGAVVIAAPLKIINGSGSPCRVIALVPTANA
jgi:kynurenine formamidase